MSRTTDWFLNTDVAYLDLFCLDAALLNNQDNSIFILFYLWLKGDSCFEGDEQYMSWDDPQRYRICIESFSSEDSAGKTKKI